MILVLLFCCRLGLSSLSGENPKLDEKIEQLMLDFSVPGLQLAVMKDDSVLYARSYGYADKETGELVTDSSLFRIASISKPVTAITILKMAESGKLDLNRTVFGQGGILSDDFEGIDFDEKVKGITVKHLLWHRSGWTNKPDDPMFWSGELSRKQLISKILETRPPEHEPGTEAVYSNFGYCVLGRVIEKITGMPYEQYVRDSILQMCGITDMYIGGDQQEDRFPAEVTYYSMERTGAYDMAVRRMDSHGGWIASAKSLLKFLSKIDRNEGVTDFISPEMLTDSYFNFFEWVHTGSLPGTTSIISRINDQYGFVVLANSRPRNQEELFERLRNIIKETYSCN